MGPPKGATGLLLKSFDFWMACWGTTNGAGSVPEYPHFSFHVMLLSAVEAQQVDIVNLLSLL